MSEVLVIEEIPCENGDGMIAKVTINRPDKLNALNQDVTSSIKEMCKWAEENDSIRCVVITGAKPNPPPEGKRAKPHAFVAGADITEFVGKGSQEIRELFRDNAIEAIWNLNKPTIAMVDGFALGGGCEVACSCDIRIASDRSIFGTNVSAEDAYRMGIVNHLCTPDDLESKTMEIAQTIASKSMHTLRVAKQTIRASLDNGITDGVEIEAVAFANLFDTEDKEIGVQAFLNRSEPEWKHR